MDSKINSRNLLEFYDMIHNVSLGSGMFLRRKDHKIQKSSKPMNDLYWTSIRSINDKAANWNDFKYLDYEDSNMMRIKKFKKGD